MWCFLLLYYFYIKQTATFTFKKSHNFFPFKERERAKKTLFSWIMRCIMNFKISTKDCIENSDSLQFTNLHEYIFFCLKIKWKKKISWKKTSLALSPVIMWVLWRVCIDLYSYLKSLHSIILGGVFSSKFGWTKKRLPRKCWYMSLNDVKYFLPHTCR